MTNMSINQLKDFALNIIEHYATYNSFEKQYELNTYDIPDSELNKFSALIMQLDDDRASEATGPDNPFYESKMLPALINYLKDTSNRDSEIEFNKSWINGTTQYNYRLIKEYIQDALEDYNSNKGLAYQFGFISNEEDARSWM